MNLISKFSSFSARAFLAALLLTSTHGFAAGAEEADEYDRLDGHGRSGKKVQVIQGSQVAKPEKVSASDRMPASVGAEEQKPSADPENDDGSVNKFFINRANKN